MTNTTTYYGIVNEDSLYRLYPRLCEDGTESLSGAFDLARQELEQGTREVAVVIATHDPDSGLFYEKTLLAHVSAAADLMDHLDTHAEVTS
jgi:hypothetical protein